MNRFTTSNNFPLDPEFRANTSGDFVFSWSWKEEEFQLGAIERGEWVLKSSDNENTPVFLSGAVSFDTDGVINTASISNNGALLPPGTMLYQIRITYTNGFEDVWFQGLYAGQRGLIPKEPFPEPVTGIITFYGLPITFYNNTISYNNG